MLTVIDSGYNTQSDGGRDYGIVSYQLDSMSLGI